MGQGTESCGGYEVDYDPVEEGLHDGLWQTRSGGSIKVEEMSMRHLHNAKRIARAKAECATFSCDAETWRDWVELLDREIDRRAYDDAKPSKTALKRVEKAVPAPPVRGSSVTMICHCKAEYTAREADLKRGWGLSCSKRCSAIRREFGRPAGRRK